mgnify:CR=1 FL=1
MFGNLNAEMGRKRLTIRKVSKRSGIQYDSLRNKMSGRTEFTHKEMYLIKNNCFPDKTIDYLFAKDKEPPL